MFNKDLSLSLKFKYFEYDQYADRLNLLYSQWYFLRWNQNCIFDKIAAGLSKVKKILDRIKKDIWGIYSACSINYFSFKKNHFEKIFFRWILDMSKPSFKIYNFVYRFPCLGERKQNWVKFFHEILLIQEKCKFAIFDLLMSNFELYRDHIWREA